MYIYEAAITLKIGVSEKWTQEDIADVDVSELLMRYRGLYITVSNIYLSDIYTLNLFDIEDRLLRFDGTLREFLIANDNATLPVTIGHPEITRKNAIFSDALRADFSIQSVNRFVGNQVGLSEHAKKDARLTHYKTIDYRDMQRSMMACVNGLYHRTDANTQGYYIVDANKTRLQSQENLVGLYSFGSMGRFDQMPITEDMIAFEKEPNGLVTNIFIRADDCICDKSIILVLGGYFLRPDDQTVLMLNPNTLNIKFRRYPIVERYLESLKYLDFSEFGLTRNTSNPQMVIEKELRSEAFLRKYLTMSQSFLVLLDAKDIVSELDYPERENIPHTYLAYEKPRWPMVVGHGRHEVFWFTQEENISVIRGINTLRDITAAGTTTASGRPIVDDALYPGRAQKTGPSFFLKLSSEEINIVHS